MFGSLPQAARAKAWLLLLQILHRMNIERSVCREQNHMLKEADPSHQVLLTHLPLVTQQKSPTFPLELPVAALDHSLVFP